MKTRLTTGSRKTYSRLIAALFVSGFLVYGIGAAMTSSVTSAPNFLGSLSAHTIILVIGAALMLTNTLVDVGKGVLFFPILRKHSKRAALAYLAAVIVEVVLLDAGVFALLMLVPLSNQHSVVAGAATALVHANAMAYQVGEMFLAAGSIALCALLFRTRLIPRWLSISGLIGYPILLAGAVAEVFGIHIGLALTVPGTFFELALPVWLFTKGFQREAYAGDLAPRLNLRRDAA
ncbi:MAG: DUF4386 domain-containing protein [Candidatus Dormibacteria bacterium]